MAGTLTGLRVAILAAGRALRTDIRNAGGNAVDQEVVTDGNLVSSRKPDDLAAFGRAIAAHFADAKAHAAT